jgi:hypothetical protein
VLFLLVSGLGNMKVSVCDLEITTMSVRQLATLKKINLNKPNGYLSEIVVTWVDTYG